MSYTAARHALIGATRYNGHFVSVGTIAARASRSADEWLPWELMVEPLKSMHEYGMATVRGTGIHTEARYDGIVVHYASGRKGAIVTPERYAISNWDYLRDPDNAWIVEEVPSWATEE